MLIRYPGSKDKHISLLAPYLERAAVSRKVYEPFAGTAAITFYLLERGEVDYYHINDIDEGIAALWNQVKNNPEKLIERIKKYTPTVSDFYKFKEKLGLSEEDKAFRKLVLHQVSFSGLGAMAGGPLGGKEQQSEYTIDCRWSPDRLKKGILKCSELLNSVEGIITSEDWEKTVDAGIENKGFIYLDPPYYVQGGGLYVNGSIDHEALAQKLRTYNDWALSYDDCAEVRMLYPFASVNKLDVWSHLNKKTIADLIITPA